jgi:hypothetical protein
MPPLVEVTVMLELKETAPRGVMLDVEATDIILVVEGTMLEDIPDIAGPLEGTTPLPRLEMGTLVTTPTPSVGSATFPLTNHPPGVSAGHAGADSDGLYAASRTPVGESVFHCLELQPQNISNCTVWRFKRS